VQGNYIGTNAAGTAALRNGYNGVLIEAGAAGNTVGGAATLTVPATVGAGQPLTATATDQLGSTSEFSVPLTIE
jgi:hypothetical protein